MGQKAKRHKNLSGSMSGSLNKKGFSLLELLLALGIMAFLSSIVGARLFKRQSPESERKAFIVQLNKLMASVWYSAMTTQVPHRVVFDFKKKFITVERAKKADSNVLAKVPLDKQVFVPVVNNYIFKNVEWPETFVIKHFFIEGYDEVANTRGSGLEKSWIFVMPDGLSQNVKLIIMQLSNIKSKRQSYLFDLELNPFNTQFKEQGYFKSKK